MRIRVYEGNNNIIITLILFTEETGATFPFNFALCFSVSLLSREKVLLCWRLHLANLTDSLLIRIQIGSCRSQNWLPTTIQGGRSNLINSSSLHQAPLASGVSGRHRWTTPLHHLPWHLPRCSCLLLKSWCTLIENCSLRPHWGQEGAVVAEPNLRKWRQGNDEWPIMIKRKKIHLLVCTFTSGQ